MTIRVRYLPQGRSCEADAPIELSAAAAACDVVFEQPCASRGTCGRCRVRVHEDAPKASRADRRVLGALAEQGWRLGCTLLLQRDATIEIPRHDATTSARAFGASRLSGRMSGYGLAFDVGTTTVAGALVELRDGTVRATATALNPQSRWGADVMSRISHAESDGGAARLRDALRAALRALARHCTESAGARLQDVRSVALVGNPTMMHSLLGLDLSPLGEAPYDGTLHGSWSGSARDLGFAGTVASAYVGPAVRGHVGADAVASMIAEGLDLTAEPVLLVDLGTNSEIMLASADGIAATSAAAGPAFEAAQISQGMRAAPGAIDRVRIRTDGLLTAHVLGGGAPAGVCGSGLVDAVAELVRVGAIERSGRIRTRSELASLPALARRVESLSSGRAIRLAGRGDRAVYVTSADVRQLQLAKASIAAAIASILDRCGMRPRQVSRVLLTGAFGSSLHAASVIGIGLLPPVPLDRVSFTECSAAAGARLLLVDAAARGRAERIAASTCYVDLAGRPEYETAFVDALAFPSPPGQSTSCPTSSSAGSASPMRASG